MISSKMQDDFGDFHQAPPTRAHDGGLSRNKAGGVSKDLNSKILESFDLSGSDQKASNQFREKPRQIGKRPQSMQQKLSTGAADWRNLDVKTSDFTVRMTKQNQNQQQPPKIAHQPNYQANNFNAAQSFYAAQNQNANFQYPSGVQQPVISHYGITNPVTQMPLQQVNVFQGVINNSNVKDTNSFVPPANLVNFQQNLVPQSGRNTMQHPGHFAPTQSASNTTIGSNLVTRTSHTNIYQHQNMTNLQLVQGPKIGTFSAASSQGSNSSDKFTLPSWMTKPTEIPKLYKEVLKLCATPNSYADTARLYPIFVSSNLPKDVLGHIWSAANQSMPGQLTFSEVYIALALIALAQKGEMNLSAKYVTTLKIPPIPSLEVNMPFNNKHGGTVAVSTEKKVSNAPHLLVTAKDDDFAEFQYVPHISAPTKQTVSAVSDSSSTMPTAVSFQEFQSSVSKSSIDPSPSLSVYSRLEVQSNSANKISGNLSNINTLVNNTAKDDFKLSKSDPYKRDIFSPVSSNFLTSEGDFGKFNSAALSYPGDAMPVKIKEKYVANNNNYLAGSNAIAGFNEIGDDFGDFKASPLVSVSDLPKLSLGKKTSADIFSTPVLQTTVGMNQFSGINLVADDNSGDKYSALRDLVPIVADNKLEPEKPETDVDFADFQSVTAQQDTADTIVSNASSIVASASSHSFFGKSIFEKEDANSVKSLELPSLSKTISTLSIGSISPPHGIEESYSAFADEKDDFTVENFAVNNKNASQTNLPMIYNHPPAMTIKPTVSSPVSQDDGLYSLDEPISPLSQRKTSEAGSNAQTDHKIISPHKVKRRFVVPRRISEADSDFGDFASGPPPIDDTSDHLNSEFDLYQGGNSSLVDFDAFGHLQDAKEEVKRKKETEFKKKTGKEEATAFSEFVKSHAVINLSTTCEKVNGASAKICKNDQVNEEDWNDFNEDRDKTQQTELRTIDSTLKTTILDEKPIMDQMSAKTFENKKIEQETPAKKTWKLESTISAAGNDIQIDNSKWEAEGEDMRARMEGTDTSSTKELYTDHWGRCLTTCKDIIVSTSEIFAALNRPSVCHEIVNSTRGKEFISCTSEVYGVARRICKGMESVNLSDDDLEQTLREIEIAWNNLLGFCPYTPSVHKTPEHCCSTAKQEQVESKINGNVACSLCLLSIFGSSLADLEYGGKSYHAPCANLWLNQIAPILPRLEVPSVF